jgi:putative Mg2+ transporter-C (MgtC) family protein
MIGDLSLTDILLRAATASLFGGVIGWDRERHDKAAGLRTMMLVSLGACAAILSTLLLSADLDAEPKVQLDPARVISGIVGGVGFLGAGSIIQSGGKIRGMTTAATIWVAAGIGITAGLGQFALAGVITAFALIMLVAVGALKGSVLPEKHQDQA